jgi:DNA ligase (NAD+)
MDSDFVNSDILDFAANEEEVFLVLTALDTAFEANEPCINPITGEEVSNHQYDLIRKESKIQFPDNPYWDRVTGSTYKPNAPTIRLEYPMTSLEKQVGPSREADYVAWIKRCQKELGKDVKFCKSLKIDGVGVSIEYVKGIRVRAGLRPQNGYDAEDRTKNVEYVIGVPETLPLPLTCTVRGELYVTKSDFEQINEELFQSGKIKEKFKNERNYTTGSVRQDNDPSETGRRKIRFIAHSIVGLGDVNYTTETNRATFCRDTFGIPCVEITPHNPLDLDDLYEMEKTVNDQDCLIDGIVLMVDNLEAQEQMGTHGNSLTGNPVGKVAWKLPDEEKSVTVAKMVKQTGRTGKITYVAVFETPVQLEKTEVSRCTLHNLGFVHTNGIDVGTEGVIVKAGKIIPKWIRTTSNLHNHISDMTCPTCRHRTQIIPGSKPDKYNEVCVNRQCPEQLVNNLLHYLRVFGVKGLGTSALKALAMGEEKLVKSPADFYRLNVPQIQKAGLSERQALLAMAAIHMVPDPSKEKDNGKLAQRISAAMLLKKSTPLWVFFASCGVKGAGKSTGKALVDHFGELSKIRGATKDQLLEVDNIGPITAISIRAFFDENSAMIDDLLNYVEPELPKTTGTLQGYTFVLSGDMDPYKKKDIEQMIAHHGGKLSGSVSKGMVPSSQGYVTAYLVAGPNSGSKSDKAKQLGVPIISVKEFLNILG